jgi:hypothetical protein
MGMGCPGGMWFWFIIERGGSYCRARSNIVLSTLKGGLISSRGVSLFFKRSLEDGTCSMEERMGSDEVGGGRCSRKQTSNLGG